MNIRRNFKLVDNAVPKLFGSDVQAAQPNDNLADPKKQRKPRQPKEVNPFEVQPYYFLKNKRKHKEIIDFLNDNNKPLTAGNYTMIEYMMSSKKVYNPNKKTVRPKKPKQPIQPIQPVEQTAHVKIVLKYEAKIFHGKRWVKTIVDNPEDYVVVKYTNQNQFNQQINDAYAQLIKKLQDTMESGYADMKVLDKKYYFVSESQLNAAARDPTIIPMKKAMPISYKFILVLI